MNLFDTTNQQLRNKRVKDDLNHQKLVKLITCNSRIIKKAGIFGACFHIEDTCF